MLMQCAVVEAGGRCEEKAYTTVRDPACWDASTRNICRHHFERAYQRAEMFNFSRARRQWQPKADAV